MRNWLTLLFLCINCVVLAQPLTTLYKPNYTLPSTDSQTVLDYAKQWIPENRQHLVQLHINCVKSTSFLTYVTYNVLYNQYYCWGSSLKLSFYPNGKVHSVQAHWPSWDSLQASYNSDYVLWDNSSYSTILESMHPSRQRREHKLVWYPKQGLRLAVSCWSLTSDYTLMLNYKGEITDSISHELRYGRDTFVHARVFIPDPLTVQGLTYGGNIIDNQDADLPWFEPAYYSVKVPATFHPQSGLFALYNAWVSLEEFEAPVVEPVRLLNQNFLFRRNESGFEDVMTMYHIMAFRKQLTNLGYPQLMNQVLHVDAHAQFGADNSMFVRNGGEPSLRLGTGGVDDAEDADVIIHEYAHGLSWSANNNINFSFERSALDEGLADYWATSYSRSISPVSWANVFTWDGHNEFWSGRSANTTRLYPSNGNIYQVGEIWNAVLSKLWSDLGSEITDRLLLESMFFYTEQTTLPEAAMFFIEADSLLYNGVHTPIICQRFQQQGILGGNCLPLNVNEYISTSSNPQLLNTQGFAFNNESLAIMFDKPTQGYFRYIGIDGRLIDEGNISLSTRCDIPTSNGIRGMAILCIETSTGERYQWPVWRSP